MSLLFWNSDERLYEPAGGRCLCDECCAARPERLIERAEVRKRLEKLAKETRYKY